MQSYLKSYEVVLQTRTPVFIGNGGSIGKKEYIYERFDNRILLLNMFKFYQGLKQKRLIKAYEEYMLSGFKDLFVFLKENNIQKSEYKTWVSASIPVADKDLINRKTKQILTFVSDAYGCPYIPGSSIKGALRTALLSDRLLSDQKLSAQMVQKIQTAPPASRKRYLQKEDKELDCTVMHRKRMSNARLENEVNDVLAGLIIGDSSPLSKNDMCICQKVDYTVDSSTRPLPILRECLKPGIDIHFTITIDTKVCPYTIKDIIRSLDSRFKNYCTEFVYRFPQNPTCNCAMRDTVLMLGGGIGFPSKTVVYDMCHGLAGRKLVSRIIHATIDRNSQRRHDHLHDPDKGASPHMLKCTVYNGELMQMGMCCIKKIAEVSQ